MYLVSISLASVTNVKINNIGIAADIIITIVSITAVMNFLLRTNNQKKKGNERGKRVISPFVMNPHESITPESARNTTLCLSRLKIKKRTDMQMKKSKVFSSMLFEAAHVTDGIATQKSKGSHPPCFLCDADFQMYTIAIAVKTASSSE
jgi:hypothetical protein